MNRQDIFELIVRHTQEVVPDLQRHVFSDDDRLQSLGANSVDRAEIVTLVLGELALEIPRVEAFGPESIGGLADLLHAKLSARKLSAA